MSELLLKIEKVKNKISNLESRKASLKGQLQLLRKELKSQNCDCDNDISEIIEKYEKKKMKIEKNLNIFIDEVNSIKDFK